MRRSLVALVPVGVSLLLSACDTDRAPLPSGISPGQARADRPATGGCSVNGLNNLAQAFFKSGDPVFTKISDMKTTYNRSGAAAATPLGFDILERVATVRLTSAQLPGSTTDAGAALVRGVVACMDLGTIPDTFNPELALAQGVFEVRGAVANAPEALAYNGTAAGEKVQFSPRWGVEPRTASGWPTSTGSGSPRFLVYGYPIANADFFGETPVDGFNAFEVGTLRSDVNRSAMRVGVCIKTAAVDEYNTTVAANLLQHDAQFVTNESPVFCVGYAGATLAKTWLASITGGVTSLFTPKPAFAQLPGDDELGRFIGGGPSGWSPMKFGKLTKSTSGVNYPAPIKNGNISSPIPAFVVHAQSAAGHGIPGVTVTITLTNNQGEPAGAVITPGSVVTVVTNTSGDATFDKVSVGKAGGYTFTASGVLGSLVLQSVISNVFNMKNK